MVDDEPTILSAVATRLHAEAFQVETAVDGPSAVDTALATSPDLVVLDVMLPGFDGLEVCRRIQAQLPVPVLMLTARTDETDMLVGLGIGADDYLTKPFDRSELIARIHAIVRRSKGHAQSVINVGRLAVNLAARTVSIDGQTVHLTTKEYGILELLSLRKGTTLTKEMFLNHLYGGLDEPELKIIDVFICKLRKKLATVSEGEHYIETVWGRGYMLRDPQIAPAMVAA